MGGKRSRNKGRNWEQAIARLLRPIFGERIHRGDQRRGGGAAAGEGCDVDGSPWYVEAKHGFSPSIPAAMRQAIGKQAEAADERPPVAMCKVDAPPPGWRPGQCLAPPTATMLLKDWLALVEDWARLRRLVGEGLVAPVGSADTRNA